MTYLPVARACAQARDVYFMRSEAMRDHVSEIYEAHKMRPSDRLEVECAFFINWCIEIAIRNTETGLIDRWAARRAFNRHLDASLAPLVFPASGDLNIMKQAYRQRYREVLATVWNIHLSGGDGDRPQPPLTPKTARMFLRNSVQNLAQPRPAIVEPLHHLLRELFWRYASDVLSKAPGV